MPPRRAVTGRSQEPRQRFVEELRLLRAQKGDSLRQLGEVLGWDWSLFGKMEGGQTLGGPEVAQALDQHYGTPGLLLTLWELAASDPKQFKERYRRYMTLEAEAVSLWHFGVSTIHGLLQTDEYAYAVLAVGGLKGDDLTRQVDARTGRRELLTGDDAPPFAPSSPRLCCARRWKILGSGESSLSTCPGRPSARTSPSMYSLMGLGRTAW